MSSTITTPDTGLAHGDGTYTVNGFAVPFYFASRQGDASTFTDMAELMAGLVSKVPVLGLYGGQDTGIPMPLVQAMQDALAAAAGDNTAAAASHIVVYDEAPHAFYADYRPSYRKDIAEPAFERALDWLVAKGVA